MVPQLGQGFLQPNGREGTGEPQRWQAGLSIPSECEGSCPAPESQQIPRVRSG